MTSPRLRDRDAIITPDNIVFRVYGYSHPPEGYICDPEYAQANVYNSKNPRAYRAKDDLVYYKFFADEGLKFVQLEMPQYMVWYPPLQRSLVGVKKEQIAQARHPEKTFQLLLEKGPSDVLLQALHSVFDFLRARSKLSETDFGVFGSLLHSFYHPTFSDLDLIIYGQEKLKRLRETLNEMYQEDSSPLRNEFDNEASIKGKHWEFKNYNLKEYISHQRRKHIYALFDANGRTIKTEFEPVKRWEEIQNEYCPSARIKRKGWIKVLARVTDDQNASFMPSIYQIEPMEIFHGKRVDNIQRIVSYVEEFRMQAQEDELVVVEGNLEQVTTEDQIFNQVTLTYGPRYYEQTLKLSG